MNTIILLLFSISMIASSVGYSQTNQDYHLSLGIVGTTRAVGLQAELPLPRNLSIRLVGVKELNYQRATEYGYTGVGLLAYTFPSRIDFIEPFIGIGPVYSIYHWDLLNAHGNIHDVTLGGGFGINFRFNEQFRAGINLFLVNTFVAEYNSLDREMVKDRRQLQVFPTLTLDFLLLR